MKIQGRLFFPFLLIVIWALACIAKLKFNGLILGLDYGLYHPDGAYYTYRTLTFLGHDSVSAAQQVSDWYLAHSSKHVFISVPALVPETNPAWGLVAPRLLYPILSIPFVALFGIPGTLVVPALSLLVTIICCFVFISKRSTPFIGFLVSATLLLSPTVMRWSLANCTDAISMALFAFVPLVRFNVDKPRNQSALIFLLVVLTSLNRFCAPVWIAIGFVYWIWGRKKESITATTASVLSAVPIFLLAPNTGFLPLESESSFIVKILKVPVSMSKVGFYEIGQLWVLDRTLFALILVATICSIRHLRWIESQLFIGVALATWVTGGLNGVIGVNFRYQLPLIPFMIIVLARLILQKSWLVDTPENREVKKN